MKRKYLAATIALAAVLATGACSASVSVGSKQVDKSAVESQITTQLEPKVGKTFEDVTCPDNLDAKVDATVTCTVTMEGSEYDTIATVTSVDGDNVKFDVNLSTTPNN
ncbi:hypothetical protein B2J88_24880 [Rhodococcus sp. SRB_17]|nr:hypothetical protein [Rhodococcus sp. SRB_17]